MSVIKIILMYVNLLVYLTCDECKFMHHYQLSCTGKMQLFMANYQPLGLLCCLHYLEMLSKILLRIVDVINNVGSIIKLSNPIFMTL